MFRVEDLVQWLIWERYARVELNGRIMNHRGMLSSELSSLSVHL
jgi:hypothetical protein